MKNKYLILILLALLILPIYSGYTAFTNHNEKIVKYVNNIKLNTELFYLKNQRYPADLAELEQAQKESMLTGYDDSMSYSLIKEGEDCEITGTLWLKGTVKVLCSEENIE